MSSPGSWPVVDRCSVCHEMVPLEGTVMFGTFDGEGEEMVLCANCAALVFPGMREAVASHCPFCREH